MRQKIKPATFKHIEAEIYGYYETKEAISLRRQELMFGNGSDENVGAGSNSYRTPGRPTEQIATTLTLDKQLRNYEEIVSAIDKVYERLPDDYKRLMQIRYWKHNNYHTWETISQHLFISRRQAMRWRDEIVYAIAEILGWW